MPARIAPNLVWVFLISKRLAVVNLCTTYRRQGKNDAIMYIDDSKLNSYSREELEKTKMAIDIAKVIRDMEMDRKQHEMDKQRYENERMERQAQLNAEAEERKVRIAKMQAEIDEAIKKAKRHPPSSVIVAAIACFGSIVIALIAAVTFWLTNPV